MSAQLPTSSEWSSLSEAKSACTTLSSSPAHLAALTELTLTGVLSLNGLTPTPSEQADVDLVLATLASLPNLHTLTLLDTPYTWLPQPSPGLLPSSQLHTLKVHDPDEDLIARLLPSQSSIRVLELWSLQSPMEWDAPEPADVLPKLESVAGYPAVIEHFVPGRPVRSIGARSIMYVVPIADIIAWARLSTAKVTELDVAVLEDERGTAVGAIAEALGDSLKELTVRYHMGKKIDSIEAFKVLQADWTSALSKAAALQSFTAMMWFETDEAKPDVGAVASSLGEACASLKNICVGGKEWKRDADGWKVAED